jgi:hypothetical protein
MRATVRWCVQRVVLLALVGAAGGSLGCRTPQSLCNEYYDERNAFEDRCGLPITDRELICQEGNETNCGCGAVSVVRDPQDVVQRCFDYYRNYDCISDPRGTLVDYPMNQPVACDPTSQFMYVDN